jgi:hypothetical protein
MAEIKHEAKELFDSEPSLNLVKMPSWLCGDELRVKYIILFLIQKVTEKNKLERSIDKIELVRLEISVSDDD